MRVKRGTTSLKHRKNVLKRTKGFRNALKKKERAAHEAILHAGMHAFAHRRDKKNDFRRLWEIKIGAKVRELGTSYSKFMGTLKKKDIALDRKSLATLAEHHPESFKRVYDQVVK